MFIIHIPHAFSLSLSVAAFAEHFRDEGWPNGEKAVGRGGPCSEREQEFI
jgi:hypothetical protein